MKTTEMFENALPGELNEDLRTLRSQLMDAQQQLEAGVRRFARGEHAYRKKRASVYLGTRGTVDERKAATDLSCEKEMLEAHISEGLMKAALENVRNLRTMLSTIQTEAHNRRAELQLAYGPEPEERD